MKTHAIMRWTSEASASISVVEGLTESERTLLANRDSHYYTQHLAPELANSDDTWDEVHTQATEMKTSSQPLCLTITSRVIRRSSTTTNDNTENAMTVL